MIIVGGGSVLVDEKRQIKGVSRIIKPPHYQVTRQGSIKAVSELAATAMAVPLCQHALKYSTSSTKHLVTVLAIAIYSDRTGPSH